jgi:hypothetical protein
VDTVSPATREHEILLEPFSVRSVPGLYNEESQLSFGIGRSEKLVSEAGEGWGTKRTGNVRRWKPLPSNG